MVNAHNQDPFLDMDSEYQYVEFDDEDPPVISSNKNPWAHGISRDPESDRLKKEIEDILKEAEEAKRVAEMQNLLKQTEAARPQEPAVCEESLESLESIESQGQQSVPTAATNDASANNGTNDGKNDGKNDEKNDGSILDAAKDEVKDEVESAPNEGKGSKWREMMSSEPLMVMANVAKEVLFAVSMFSVASYLTLQFLDMQ